ncbi:hypothetical protein [Streptomyces sp. YIM S03343]
MQGFSRGTRGDAVVVLGAAVLLGLLTSCSSSSSSREYAVPKDLCGTKISSSLLEPLLPPGKKISAQPTSAVGVERCRLVVDGDMAFSSSVEQRGTRVSARDMAESAYGVAPGDASANGGRFIYSVTGAVGLVECPDHASADHSVWVTARTTRASEASDMRKFIEQYAAAVAETDACRES